MRYWYRLLFMAVYVLGLWGCQGLQKQRDTAAIEKTAITSSNLSKIMGTQWTLKEMVVEGQKYELTKQGAFIKFEDDVRVTGFSSVNRFFGAMKIDDSGRVRWPSPFGSTRMAGPAELMKQENVFLKALPKTARISTEGIYLFMRSDDGQTELVFYVPVK